MTIPVPTANPKIPANGTTPICAHSRGTRHLLPVSVRGITPAAQNASPTTQAAVNHPGIDGSVRPAANMPPPVRQPPARRPTTCAARANRCFRWLHPQTEGGTTNIAFRPQSVRTPRTPLTTAMLRTRTLLAMLIARSPQPKAPSEASVNPAKIAGTDSLGRRCVTSMNMNPLTRSSSSSPCAQGWQYDIHSHNRCRLR